MGRTPALESGRSGSQWQHSLHEKANQSPYSFFLCKIRIIIPLFWTERFCSSNSCVGAITSRVSVFGDGTTKEVIKVCCWSVTKWCPTLWDPKDCSTPGFPVLHFLPLSRCCHPTISPSVVSFSSCPQSFPASGSFQMSQFFASGGQSIGASISASVLPMNIQDRFPLGLTGLLSLQSEGFSRVSFNTTVQNHQFFSAQLSL